MNRTVEERVVVSAQLPRELRDELERRALPADRTLSAEVRRGLTRYLEAADSEKQEDA